MSEGKLILTRRAGQSITFKVGDEEFELTITDIKTSQVRIELYADPQNVQILRSELLQKN